MHHLGKRAQGRDTPTPKSTVRHSRLAHQKSGSTRPIDESEIRLELQKQNDQRLRDKQTTPISTRNGAQASTFENRLTRIEKKSRIDAFQQQRNLRNLGSHQ
jgi:hypothetical protein